MKYKLKVKAKSAWKVSHRLKMVEAFQFAADALNIYTLGDSVDDSYSLTLKLINRADCGGYCSFTAKQNIQVAICAEKNDIDYCIEALFHELTHARQFMVGDLRDVWEGERVVCYWQGKRYEFHDVLEGEASEENDEYWNAPWEVEARAVAAELMEIWNER